MVQESNVFNIVFGHQSSSSLERVIVFYIQPDSVGESKTDMKII